MSFNKVFRSYDQSDFTTPFSVEELDSTFTAAKGKNEAWKATTPAQALAWGYFRDASNREINTLSTSEFITQYVVECYADVVIVAKNSLVIGSDRYRVIRDPQQIDNRGVIQIVPVVLLGREN